MKAPRQVVSVGSHGGEYLFYVIEAVILLNHDDPADTAITFLPSDPPLARMIRKARSLVRPHAQHQQEQAGARPSDAAIYAQLRQGRSVRFERDRYTISLACRNLASLFALWSWLLAGARALRLWLRCYTHGRFQPMRFLRTRYRDVQIGDLAASTFFRTDLSADEPKPSALLFFMLWWSCYLIDITAALVDTGAAAESFTITPEPNYVHSAPYRYLRSRGFTALDIYQRNTPLRTLDGSCDISLPRHLHRDPAALVRELPADVDDLVAEYFEQRLHAAPTMLWYMSHGQNDNRAHELADTAGRPTRVERDGLYAVVFLHSFADGQYFFGVDGFESLGHWTYHTIEACLANHSFDKVLIKPHPNANYDVHPGDKRALGRIMQRYRDKRRVVILSPTSSVVGLCGATRFFGLTHHGSIAEELVYLGQPAVASTFAWWSDQYRFARLWSTPAESASLISRLSPDTWQPPSQQERNELYRFLLDFRFREVPCDRTFPSFILARLRNPGTADAPVRLRIDEETRYSRELETLAADDPMVLRLLTEFEKLAAETPLLWPLTRAG